MKHYLLLLSVLLLVSALSSCVVATDPTPVVVSGTSSGWEGAAASSYVGAVTTGFGSTYGSSYYRSPYYAPVRPYYGRYGYGRNWNGGVNRVGIRR